MSRWLLHGMLRLTYASELGAATAYAGHAAHVRLRGHQPHIEKVRDDELRHRAELLVMLEGRGLRPWAILDLFFFCVGTTVAFGCRFWGDWASATGASWFEVNGVAEYRRLASVARRLGDEGLATTFDHMAEHEQAHSDLFRELARGATASLPSIPPG
jgi:demethoxyubiquinone hydroxylase (CLK1/Coq7/Cat5 family)